MTASGAIGTLGLFVVLPVAMCAGAAPDPPATAPAAEASVENVRDASPEQIAFFEKRVRPVLAEHCYRCHSAGSAMLRANLRVDSIAGMLEGGDSGKPAVVPGRPDESLLITAIRYEDDHVKMPPAGPLEASEIEDLVAWVKMGAPYPEHEPAGEDELDPLLGRSFWSFRPLSEPEIPDVWEVDWPANDIDHFILAKLDEKLLDPAPPADRLTLIRRATFDLTGLPPTPEEIDAFLADDAPDAYARLVDRLLDSPHYGERWGRHWLDVARYADTGGESSDYPIPQAYRYRNYVIDSFNRDKPYDQFIREQIAGDLLPAETEAQRQEQIVATGFIALSRRFSVRPEGQMHLTIEDTLDTMSQGFLGLTLSCARCHDHMYDPIPTEDYYALYGIFGSTRYPFPGSENTRYPYNFVVLLPPEEAEAVAEPLAAERSALEARVAKLEEYRKTAEQARKEAGSREEDDAERANGVPGVTRMDLDDIAAGLEAAKKRLHALRVEWASVPKAYAVAEADRPRNARIHKRGNPRDAGDPVPRGFLHVLGGQKLPKDVEGSGRLELAGWLTDPENPLTARVMVNRIWQHHFGRGIVETPNDFGRQGARPTHPELLDHLARRFIESGWSVKAMHREIMLSRTYRMSSAYHAGNAEVDPDNALLWRFNRRRLSAEEIRDAMLAVSGALERDMPGAHPFPPEYEWNYTQHAAFTAVYETNHRSVYLMQQRIRKHPFLATFDGADPNASTGERLLSTTALQALFMMNNAFVFEQAERFADRLIEAASTDDVRIDLAVRLALGRPAEDGEVEEAMGYLEQYREMLRAKGTEEEEELARAALASYGRVLLSSNAFVFVD